MPLFKNSTVRICPTVQIQPPVINALTQFNRQFAFGVTCSTYWLYCSFRCCSLSFFSFNRTAARPGSAPALTISNFIFIVLFLSHYTASLYICAACPDILMMPAAFSFILYSVYCIMDIISDNTIDVLLLSPDRLQARQSQVLHQSAHALQRLAVP